MPNNLLAKQNIATIKSVFGKLPDIKICIGNSASILIVILAYQIVLSMHASSTYFFENDIATINSFSIITAATACIILLGLMSYIKVSSTRPRLAKLTRYVFGAMFMGSGFLILNIMLIQTDGLYFISFLTYCVGIPFALISLIRNLKNIGVIQSIIFSCIALVALAIALPFLNLLQDKALVIFLAVMPFLLELALSYGETSDEEQEHRLPTAKFPKRIFITMLVLGMANAINDFAFVFPNSNYMPTLLSTEAAIALGVVMLAVTCLLSKATFNRLLYLICIPSASLALLILSFPLESHSWISQVFSQFSTIAGIVALLTLCVYLAKFSEYSYAWLAVSGFLGLFAGRLLALGCASIMYEFGMADILLDYGTSAIAVAILIVNAILYGQDYKSKSWGCIRINALEYSIDKVEETCTKIATSAHLTAREKEVLFLLAQGKNLKEISFALEVSDNTSRTHMKNIYTKLGIHKRSELDTMLRMQ